MGVGLLGLFAADSDASRLYAWLMGNGFPAGPDGIHIVATGATLGLAGFGFGLFFISKPGPIQLTLDTAGVHLKYRDGRERTFSWDDPRFRLDLYDYHDIPAQRLRARLNFAYSIRDRSDAFLTPLTPDGFQAVLAAARSRGFEITSIKPPMHWAGREIRTARVLRVSRPSDQPTSSDVKPAS
jgi:hypothetical protein